MLSVSWLQGKCGIEALCTWGILLWKRGRRCVWLGSSDKSKGLSIPRKVHGPKTRMFTFSDVSLNPVTHIHIPPLTVHRATLEMTRYQKKHDLKLSRPLILPLTQVSKNVLLLVHPEPTKLSPASHVPGSPEKQATVTCMACSGGVRCADGFSCVTGPHLRLLLRCLERDGQSACAQPADRWALVVPRPHSI